MINKIVYSLVLLIATTNIYGQQPKGETAQRTTQKERTAISDGPYIFIEKGGLVEKTIVNDKVLSKNLPPDSYDTIFKPEPAAYKKIKNIAALSDIHGQYQLAIAVLKNNKVVDKNLDWNYGNGHLVIVGDIFDRGGEVNEMLWLVYKLEKQAKSKGGRVHFLLGNHEYMILHDDLRYIHKKYKRAAELLQISYPELYGTQTVLGRWLRSKPTIVKINNNIFVHGGISKDFLSIGFNMEGTNKVMRKSIDRNKDEMKSTDFYNTYYGANGPIWYRGYFNDNLEKSEISYILRRVKSKHIVVGHCSNEEVVQLYNKKIFGVDSSIKNGVYGEMLFIRGRKYYRGTLEGKRIRFR